MNYGFGCCFDMRENPGKVGVRSTALIASRSKTQHVLFQGKTSDEKENLCRKGKLFLRKNCDGRGYKMKSKVDGSRDDEEQRRQKKQWVPRKEWQRNLGEQK